VCAHGRPKDGWLVGRRAAQRSTFLLLDAKVSSLHEAQLAEDQLQGQLLLGRAGALPGRFML
jgi:hypothetical protein